MRRILYVLPVLAFIGLVYLFFTASMDRRPANFLLLL